MVVAMKSLLPLLLGVGLLTASLGCERGSPLSPDPPRTQYFEVLASRVFVSPGQTITLTAVPPNRALMAVPYRWQATAGELQAVTGLQVAWQSPDAPGSYAVSCKAVDPDGREWRGVVHLRVDRQPAQQLRVVFVSDRDGNPEIFTMKPDGSDLRQLTFTADVGHADPVWSPSAQRIAFVRYSLAEPRRRDLYIMHADGRFVQQMTQDPFQQNSPSWAPGGLKVAYGTRTFSGFLIVAVLDVDGYPEIRLSTTLGGLWPDWSSRNRIVFVKRATPSAQLAIVHSGGGEIARFAPSHDPAWPAWSPDGQRIAYISKTAPGSIFLIDSEGLHETTLRTGLAEVGPPAWSNDGSRLVFAGRRDDEDWDLYAISAQGADLKRLTFSPAADYSPHWAWLQ